MKRKLPKLPWSPLNCCHLIKHAPQMAAVLFTIKDEVYAVLLLPTESTGPCIHTSCIVKTLALPPSLVTLLCRLDRALMILLSIIAFLPWSLSGNLSSFSYSLDSLPLMNSPSPPHQIPSFHCMIQDDGFHNVRSPCYVGDQPKHPVFRAWLPLPSVPQV